MNTKKTNVAQWADYSLNVQYGCSNACLYCYAQAMAPRHRKIEVDDWNQPVLKPKIQMAFQKRSGVTMFPTTHDISPQNLKNCSDILKKLLLPGNNVLIVSKPNCLCIKSLCMELANYKSQIEFRFTIGSVNNNILSFWEPNAPSITERLNSLKYAFHEGYRTSISCEPMLDNHPENVVRVVEPFVTETIWLGKANDLIRRLKINHHQNTLTLSRAAQLLAWQSDEEIIRLYNCFKNHPKIRWKDSIEKVIEKTNK